MGLYALRRVEAAGQLRGNGQQISGLRWHTLGQAFHGHGAPAHRPFIMLFEQQGANQRPCPAGWCLRREAGPPERSPIAGAGGPAVREQAVTVFFS